MEHACNLTFTIAMPSTGMSTCAKQRFFRGFARAERGEVQGRELLKDLRFPTVRFAGKDTIEY